MHLIFRCIINTQTFLSVCFESRVSGVALSFLLLQGHFELLSLRPVLPEGWDYRGSHQLPLHVVLVVSPRALCELAVLVGFVDLTQT